MALAPFDTRSREPRLPAPGLGSTRSGVRLVVVVAVLGGASALESPVDLVGVGMPPFTHPVFEAGEQDDRDGVGGGGGDRADDDLRVGGDERGLGGDRLGDDLHRICIGTRHDTHCITNKSTCDLSYSYFTYTIDT